MLTFKETAHTFPLLRWVQQKLVFSSPLGAKKLASVPFSVSTDELNLEYDRMDRLHSMLESNNGVEFYNKTSHTVSTFRDLSQTLENIRSGLTLSELELFEVKYFAYNYGYFASLVQSYDLEVYPNEDLSPVFQLLDPDQTGVTSFYLYESYDPELGRIRKKIKNGEASEELYQEFENLGYKIRENLSLKLKAFIKQLKSALDSVACWDLLIAKVVFAREHTFCRPRICEYGKTSFTELYNPYLQTILESGSEIYQPIDLSLVKGPTLITGANMSGKTMVLKSIALAQYLVQFGFYAPAKEACVTLVDDIRILLGDTQNEAKGLSSFGAEILAISDMIETVCQGKKVLILLDEPARTTSPDEGVVIVNAIIDILAEQETMSLVTTHYNKLKTGCRCLRVRGFRKELVHHPINCENINRFIDYRLVDAKVNEGISEALTVARLLKISDKLLTKMDSGKNNIEKETN